MEEVIIEVILAHATRQCHRSTICILLSDLTNRTNSTNSINSSNSTNISNSTGTIVIMEVILVLGTCYVPQQLHKQQIVPSAQ